MNVLINLVLGVLAFAIARYVLALVGLDVNTANNSASRRSYIWATSCSVLSGSTFIIRSILKFKGETSYSI